MIFTKCVDRSLFLGRLATGRTCIERRQICGHSAIQRFLPFTLGSSGMHKQWGRAGRGQGEGGEPSVLHEVVSCLVAAGAA